MLISIVLNVALIAPILATDWCSIPSCGPGQHTMCMYSSSTNTNGCKDIRDIQTDEERSRILALHNEYRNELAAGEIGEWPKAANMQEMVYDASLEEIALRWAVQCKPGHDKCRSTPDIDYVGQNYYMISQSKPLDPSESTEKGFESWVDEISLASPKLVAAYQHATSYGHFTQAIWADTSKLGCAKIGYSKNGWHNNVLVCNYGPGGNMIGAPLYSKGQPCSQCPTGYSCDGNSQYPNLCRSLEKKEAGNKESPNLTKTQKKKPSSSSGVFIRSNGVLDPLQCLLLTLFVLL